MIPSLSPTTSRFGAYHRIASAQTLDPQSGEPIEYSDVLSPDHAATELVKALNKQTPYYQSEEDAYRAGDNAWRKTAEQWEVAQADETAEYSPVGKEIRDYFRTIDQDYREVPEARVVYPHQIGAKNDEYGILTGKDAHLVDKLSHSLSWLTFHGYGDDKEYGRLASYFSSLATQMEHEAITAMVKELTTPPKHPMLAASRTPSRNLDVTLVATNNGLAAKLQKVALVNDQPTPPKDAATGQ